MSKTGYGPKGLEVGVVKNMPIRPIQISNTDRYNP